VTLRAKILLAQTPLAIALALIAVLAGLTNAALGRNTASILQDNYRSVLAIQEMKEALDRLDVATSAPGRADRSAIADGLARFEQALSVQRGNVTERDEPAATAALVAAWGAYRQALATPGGAPPRTLYVQTRGPPTRSWR